MFLIRDDFTRQSRPAVESQMRERDKKVLPACLAAEFELAHDPTLVARIMKARDLAPCRHIASSRLLTQYLHQFRCHRRGDWQRRPQLCQQTFRMRRIVDRQIHPPAPQPPPRLHYINRGLHRMDTRLSKHSCLQHRLGTASRPPTLASQRHHAVAGSYADVRGIDTGCKIARNIDPTLKV
jgi:hypothetical protein